MTPLELPFLRLSRMAAGDAPRSAAVTPDSATPVAELVNVSYHVREHFPVIEDISLALHRYEIVCLVGQSGSGKSTILRLFAGLVQPTRGTVYFAGKPLRGVNPNAAIVFQNFALFPWLTVVENVMLGLGSEIPLAERRRQATAIVDMIGLDGYENAYPRELSGGQRQRVGFARALVTHPTLLLLDEPFSALDVLTAENLRSELLNLWTHGSMPTQSILMVTHGIEEAVSLADRIVVLGKGPGRIRAEIPVRLRHPRDRKSDAFQELVDRVYKIISDEVTLPVDAVDQVTSVTERSGRGGATASDSRVLVSPPDRAQSQRGSIASTEQETQNRAGDNAAAASPSTTNDGQPSDRPLSAAAKRQLLQKAARSNDERLNEFPALPPVRLGSVAGLLQLLASENSPVVDLYRLGQALQLDVHGLYPIVEAAEILGLLSVSEGDVALTGAGHAFVAGSVDDRKRIVRGALLVAPDARLIQTICRLLQRAKHRRIPESLVLDSLLDRYFEPSESRRQLDTAIEWGRYAELFAYDSVSGELFLEDENDANTNGMLADRRSTETYQTETPNQRPRVTNAGHSVDTAPDLE
jgi:NitT/TauT family transport system ATP-binding protein